jgi:hypothetical protein
MHHNGGNYTFTNGQYHYQDQSWMHPDPNAALRDLQTHWYQQQEADRQHQFYMQSTQNDFAGLQNAVQQTSPRPHHHNGPGWGGVAAGAMFGYYMANRQQQWKRQPPVVRPRGWKGDVWGWYVLLGLFLHFIVTPLIFGNNIGVAVFILVIGTLIWVPLWVLAYQHQGRIWDHNDALEKGQQS